MVGREFGNSGNLRKLTICAIREFAVEVYRWGCSINYGKSNNRVCAVPGPRDPATIFSDLSLSRGG
jgi:hypothetical protein